MKFLLVDNYDSFIYNLKYELEALGIEVKVCRNDIDYEEISNLANEHDAIVLSPGPSEPKQAGYCLKLIKDFYRKKPMLGICLGHQAIAEAFQSEVVHAKKVIHGKSDTVLVKESPLFSGISNTTKVARYHSLIVSDLSEQLTPIAQTKTDEIMALVHKEYPVYGVQFHPESLMTPKGSLVIENFRNIVSRVLANKEVSYVANA